MSFTITSVEHKAAAIFHDIKVGITDAAKYIAGHSTQIQAEVSNAVTVANVAVAAVDPAALAVAQNIERAGELLLGKSFAALGTAGDAANANGVNLTLDSSLIAELKDLFASASAFKLLPTVAPSVTPTK